jgi:hypothetical protein
MPETLGPGLSVAALHSEREARRLREKEGDEQLKRKHQEELAQFKKRLDNFQLTEDARPDGHREDPRLRPG